MGEGALLADEAAEDGLGLLENILAAVEVVTELAVDARRSPNADGLELGGIWMLPRPMPNRGVELGEEKLLGVLKPGKPRPDAAELLRPRPSDEGLAVGLVFGSLNVSFPKPEEGLSGRLPPPPPLLLILLLPSSQLTVAVPSRALVQFGLRRGHLALLHRG